MDEEDSFKIIEKWLHSIQSKAPSSAVILVGTHADLISKDVPNEIKEQFPQIRQSFQVSCIDGTGMDELKQYLMELASERQLEVPESYLALGNQLSKFNDPFIEKRILEEEGKAIGIVESGQFNTALAVLQTVGYLLYYPPENSFQKDIVILKSQWLVDVFKAVVTITAKAKLIQNGWLYYNSLEKLWPEMEDPSINLLLLSLLERFKIAIKYKGDRSLIPCRLDKAPQTIKKNLIEL